MEALRVAAAWGVAVLNALHYVLFKCRLLPQPQFRNYPRHWRPWLSSIFGWRRTLAVVNPERCPASGPAVFVSNHAKLDDPLFLWGAIERATAGAVHIWFMMRDDFFRGWPWDYLPFSLNELTASSGCIQISRDAISLAQLKPFMQILERGEAFLMFPGRTRTRGGMCIEYREGIEEPGGVSFFLSHGGRRAGKPIPAVPLARTHNPVTGVSTVVMGAPCYLPDGAGREAQRDFDLMLAVEISSLTQVHALHAVCLSLYLRCLHGLPQNIALEDLVRDVEQILRQASEHHYTQDGDRAQGATRDALRWLEKQGMLMLRSGPDGPCVEANASAILATPALDTRYRKLNPVKFYCNQVMHFQDVVAAAEERVLGRGNEAQRYVGTY
jgi:1-acyl-sn-glycerol-3-phosphate acyltransferase